jgi:galactose mutarotase-like enzyme
MIWTASAGDASVSVDVDRGCRLSSLTVRGRVLLIGDPARGELEWGCYPMAPFAGRVRHGRFVFDGEAYQLPCNLPPHAIHGYAMGLPWSPVDVAPGSLSGVWIVSLRGTPWPFACRVVHRVALADDGSSLSLVLEVHADDGPMPASCGWHPWWRRPVVASFDASLMWRRDFEGIPDGTFVEPPASGPFDDCFTGLRAPPVLTFDGGDGRRSVVMTIDTPCRQLVVFDERDDAVCVEPQTHPPDALNLGPAVVVPGSPLVASVTLRWSPRVFA